MKKITITRKIEIYVTSDDKKAHYQSLRDWSYMTYKAANIASSHMFFQSQTDHFFYLTNAAKVLFTDVHKNVSKLNAKEKGMIDEGYDRVLNCSQQNTTYQVLSKEFKGNLPSDIYSNLNAQLFGVFKKEANEVKKGLKSLRSYRNGMPMPFSSSSITKVSLSKNKRDYDFMLLGIPFRTKFGKDLSGNRIIFDRHLNGEYKLCNSSIQLKEDKVFMLAVFQFDSMDTGLDKNLCVNASLGIEFPIVAQLPSLYDFKIGSKGEFLYRRLAIQSALRRCQIVSKYSKGGKGRTKKMGLIDRYEKMEQNYIQTKQHQYTHMLVELCVKNKCGTLVLKSAPYLHELVKQEDIKENDILLRNWGYYGMLEKLKYKCAKYGIDMLLESTKVEK